MVHAPDAGTCIFFLLLTALAGGLTLVFAIEKKAAAAGGCFGTFLFFTGVLVLKLTGIIA